jgi:hypothetical protein
MLELLERSCRTFPESIRLAELHAWVLHENGEETGSLTEYARAMALDRQARLYRRELGKEEGPKVMWLMAENLARYGT